MCVFIKNILYHAYKIQTQANTLRAAEHHPSCGPTVFR